MMKEGESDQQTREKVVDGISRQRVWDDENRRDLVMNKTGLKWCHLKHMHVKVDFVVSVCYRLSDQAEGVYKAFFRQVEEDTRSHFLVLMRDFHHADGFWRDNTAGHKQSRRSLECINDNFLTSVTEGKTRRGTLLDHTCKRGRIDQECEGWEQSWLM